MPCRHEPPFMLMPHAHPAGTLGRDFAISFALFAYFQLLHMEIACEILYYVINEIKM